ncbi:hypothetical protein D9M73_157700 [compost metagenome]
MEADQMMTFWRFAQRLGQQLQLIIGQVTRDRTRHCRIQQGDAPVADIHDRLEQVATRRDFGHLRALVMIATQPAGGRSNFCGRLAKAPVGIRGSILRQVAGGQQQIHFRLLLQHLLHHSLQAVSRVHAQQRATGIGKQMAIGQLHQQGR